MAGHVCLVGESASHVPLGSREEEDAGEPFQTEQGTMKRA